MGGLRGAGAAPHLCDGAVSPAPPSVACAALSVPPRPPPGWREGAPRVGAGLEDYMNPGQGRPAAPRAPEETQRWVDRALAWQVDGRPLTSPSTVASSRRGRDV